MAWKVFSQRANPTAGKVQIVVSDVLLFEWWERFADRAGGNGQDNTHHDADDQNAHGRVSEGVSGSGTLSGGRRHVHGRVAFDGFCSDSPLQARC